MLFNRYTAEATKETYNYSSFCRRYDQWRRDNGILTVGGNVERVPGQRMEIDFAGDLLEWIDDNGCVQRCKLFVATLPYSNIIFTEAFADETKASWINGIVDALEYFGAVPEVLVMDNARALVNRDGWRDVNAQIRKRLDAINTQSFRAKHAQGSRRMLYEREEKVHMRALPAMPYDPGDWKLLTVDKAHCVRIASEAGHRYSTPATYVGKKVAVRVSRDAVEIFDLQSMKSLGTHRRCTDLNGNKTHILEEHLTPNEKHYRRSADDWVNLLVKKGLPKPLAAEFISALLNDKGGFPSARICGSVCGLFRTYPPDIIRRAVGSALEDQTLRAGYIKQLCEQYQFAHETNWVLDLEGSQPNLQAPIVHSNIRNHYK